MKTTQQLFDTMEEVFTYSKEERRAAIGLIKYIFELDGANIYGTAPHNFFEFNVCRVVLKKHMNSELSDKLSKQSEMWKRLLDNWGIIEELYKEHKETKKDAVFRYLEMKVNNLI